jgi:tRNA uridine 5-carbamoylmethylation protein Kti12
MNNKIIAITGAPGTGKTWLLRQLKNIFKENLILCATTNLAASILKSENGKNTAKTCHNKFNQSPINDSFIHCWNINEKRRICYNHKIFCIDEASMASKKMIDWISKYYPNYIIILIGDPDQLPMVKTSENCNDEDWQDIDFDLHYNLIGNHRIADKILQTLLHALINDDIKLVSSIIRPKMVEKEVALPEINKKLWITYTNRTRIDINKAMKTFVGMRIMSNLYKTNKTGGKFLVDSAEMVLVEHNNISLVSKITPPTIQTPADMQAVF